MTLQLPFRAGSYLAGEPKTELGDPETYGDLHSYLDDGALKTVGEWLNRMVSSGASDGDAVDVDSCFYSVHLDLYHLQNGHARMLVAALNKFAQKEHPGFNVKREYYLYPNLTETDETKVKNLVGSPDFVVLRAPSPKEQTTAAAQPAAAGQMTDEPCQLNAFGSEWLSINDNDVVTQQLNFEGGLDQPTDAPLSVQPNLIDAPQSGLFLFEGYASDDQPIFGNVAMAFRRLGHPKTGSRKLPPKSSRASSSTYQSDSLRSRRTRLGDAGCPCRELVR